MRPGLRPRRATQRVALLFCLLIEWAGAGSNRRPSAFQVQSVAQPVSVAVRDRRPGPASDRIVRCRLPPLPSRLPAATADRWCRGHFQVLHRYVAIRGRMESMGRRKDKRNLCTLCHENPPTLPDDEPQICYVCADDALTPGFWEIFRERYDARR